MVSKLQTEDSITTKMFVRGPDGLLDRLGGYFVSEVETQCLKIITVGVEQDDRQGNNENNPNWDPS